MTHRSDRKTNVVRWTLSCMAMIVAAAWIGQPAVSDDEAEPNTLTPQQEAEGWQLLFDGESPQVHWRGYNREDLPSEWHAEDGWLICPGEGGDIITRDQFESFELFMEWKIEEGSNSGVFYRVKEVDAPIWHSGPEYQILDRSGDQTSPQAVGSLYDLVGPAEDATRPAGEVNTARIVIDGDQLTHYLNGVKLLELEIGGEQWTERVNDSKFHELPDFGTEEVGHIGLQDHGDWVAYRNIRIRPLDKNGAADAE